MNLGSLKYSAADTNGNLGCSLESENKGARVTDHDPVEAVIQALEQQMTKAVGAEYRRAEPQTEVTRGLLHGVPVQNDEVESTVSVVGRALPSTVQLIRSTEIQISNRNEKGR